MKKISIIIFAAFFMTSCYSNRIVVGNIQGYEPLIEVNREWNHHFLFGLVPLDNATMKADRYVGEHENYVVKTRVSFLNGLVEVLTWGIYTPTETVYYIPLKDITIIELEDF